MRSLSGVSSSHQPLVTNRHGDWALTSDFPHDRRRASYGCCDRLSADTDRRLYRRRGYARTFMEVARKGLASLRCTSSPKLIMKVTGFARGSSLRIRSWQPSLIDSVTVPSRLSAGLNRLTNVAS